MTPRSSSPGYWVLVSGLCIFGVIGIFSIGMPFLLLGVTLAVVAPWRTRPAVLWPAVAGVVALVVGYVALAPLSCTAEASELSAERTTCSNALGIDYSGGEDYMPSLVPAVLAGLVLSLLVTTAVRMILRKRDRRRPEP